MYKRVMCEIFQAEWSVEVILNENRKFNTRVVEMADS